MMRRCRCGFRVLEQHVPFLTDFETRFYIVSANHMPKRVFECPQCGDHLDERSLLPDMEPVAVGA